MNTLDSQKVIGIIVAGDEDDTDYGPLNAGTVEPTLGIKTDAKGRITFSKKIHSITRIAPDNSEVTISRKGIFGKPIEIDVPIPRHDPTQGASLHFVGVNGQQAIIYGAKI